MIHYIGVKVSYLKKSVMFQTFKQPLGTTIQNLFKSLQTEIKNHWPLFIFLLLGIVLRFINIENALYFIWDQGRDAWAIHAIAQGNPVLVGPTSGLHGFFLGPLWYYAGLPGYLLSPGNPYFLSIWYVFLGTLAIPLYWLIGKSLFSDPKDLKWAYATALLLSFSGGSILSSIFVWNPLISLPLVALSLVFALQMHRSNFAVAGSFLFMALTLQSEFAYAIFMLPVLFLCMILARWQVHTKTISFAKRVTQLAISTVIAIISVAVTLLPQALFEIRNNFIMTQSLLKGITSAEGSIAWIDLWLRRPDQLFHATKEFLLGNYPFGNIYIIPVILIFIFAVIHILFYKKNAQNTVQKIQWQITALLALTPYFFFMFWRGNYGNLFSYYLTPHIIIMMPVIVYGCKVTSQAPSKIENTFPIIKKWSKKYLLHALPLLGSGVLFILLATGTHATLSSILFVENNAGLKSMDKSLSTLLYWAAIDEIEQPTIRIFTPNMQTEHYDYILHWLADKNDSPIPFTQRQPDDKVWYLLMEEDREIPEKRFIPWYEAEVDGAVQLRSLQSGAHKLEAWSTVEFASQSGYLDENGLSNL